MKFFFNQKYSLGTGYGKMQVMNQIEWLFLNHYQVGGYNLKNSLILSTFVNG
jgi:hypothetical protein